MLSLPATKAGVAAERMPLLVSEHSGLVARAMLLLATPPQGREGARDGQSKDDNVDAGS